MDAASWLAETSLLSASPLSVTLRQVTSNSVNWQKVCSSEVSVPNRESIRIWLAIVQSRSGSSRVVWTAAAAVRYPAPAGDVQCEGLPPPERGDRRWGRAHGNRAQNPGPRPFVPGCHRGVLRRARDRPDGEPHPGYGHVGSGGGYCWAQPVVVGPMA